MEYITVKEKIITGHFVGSSLPEGAIEVHNFCGKVGETVDFFDEKMQRKSDLQLYKEKLKPIPEGYKWNKDKSAIIEMSLSEKVDSKIITIPDGCKIENDKIIPMTNKEKFENGFLSVEEYSEIQRQKRNSLLQQTDKYLIADFPIDADTLSQVKSYRQSLRDLPKQKGFPDVEIPIFNFI